MYSNRKGEETMNKKMLVPIVALGVLTCGTAVGVAQSNHTLITPNARTHKKAPTNVVHADNQTKPQTVTEFSSDPKTGVPFKNLYAWYEDQFGNVTIKGLRTKYNPDNYKEIIIPDTIEGKKVISVSAADDNGKWKNSGENPTWTEFSDVSKVTFGKNVKEIGYRAFANSDIKKLDIPETVKTIGESAFEGSDVQKIEGGENVGRVEDNAFLNVKIKDKVDISDDIKGDTTASGGEVSTTGNTGVLEK
jgi:hypothetical protein